MGSLYFVYLDLGWIHAYLCVFACLRRQATLSHSHESRHTTSAGMMPKTPVAVAATRGVAAAARGAGAGMTAVVGATA